MSSGFPERKFFPLPLAAARLNCTVQDLIHFASTGQITISVYLDTGWDGFVHHSTVKDGVWDFLGQERPAVEYQGLAAIPDGYVGNAELPGKMVSSNLFHLPDGRNIMHAPWAKDEFAGGRAQTEFSADELFLSADELKRLERLRGDQTSPGEPLLPEQETPKSRRTLLRLIAALCVEAKVNPADRGAAATLAAITQRAGLPVGDDTIRKVLAELPEASKDR